MLKPLITTISFLALSACASSGVKVDQSKLSDLHKGETTYQQAVQKLGKPSSVMLLDDGSRTAMYIYTSAQARPESFIPIVGAFVGGADTENTFTTLNFDKNGILQRYSSNQGAMGIGTGFEAYSQKRTEVNGN